VRCGGSSLTTHTPPLLKPRSTLELPSCRTSSALLAALLQRGGGAQIQRYEVLPCMHGLAHSRLPSLSCISFRLGARPCLLGPPPCSLPLHTRVGPHLPRILKTSQPAPLRHHSVCEAVLFRHLFTCRCSVAGVAVVDGPQAQAKALVNTRVPRYPFAPNAVLSLAHRRRCRPRVIVGVSIAFTPSLHRLRRPNCRLRILLSPLVSRRSPAAARDVALFDAFV
jgi:hypothetical protein